MESMELMESMLTQLHTGFRHSLMKMLMHFKLFDSRFQRYGSIVKNSMMKFAPDDLLWMIFDAKILSILNKYPFESLHSIAETLRIAHSTMLLHLHDFNCFRSFYLHWVPNLFTYDLHENGWNMLRPCCPSCMLPNGIVGIILWPVMSRDFSLIHYHVADGLCGEITWSQSRDLIFRVKIHIYDHVESERLLCCWQTPKWYQNEQRLFYDKHAYSTWTKDLLSKKSAASEKTCDSSWQLFSSCKSGFNRLNRKIWHAPHATPTLFAWFGPSDFYLFSTVKEKLELIQVADKD
jgi:hypothetical protein